MNNNDELDEILDIAMTGLAANTTNLLKRDKLRSAIQSLLERREVEARNRAIGDCAAVIRNHQFTGSKEIADEIASLRSKRQAGTGEG